MTVREGSTCCGRGASTQVPFSGAERVQTMSSDLKTPEVAAALRILKVRAVARRRAPACLAPLASDGRRA